MEIKRATYKDQIIKFIYEEILKGNIKPKEQIKESHLSKQLNISRAPIREALKELVSMELVEYKPRIGTFVVDMKPKDIYDTYIARGVLEGFAVSTSSKQLSIKDIDELSNMCEEMENLAKKHENIKLINLGDQFHERIFTNCNNGQIIKLASTLTLKSHLLFSKYWPKLYSPQEIKERHLIIIESIKLKNSKNIENTIRKHYEETGKKIANLKEKGV